MGQTLNSPILAKQSACCRDENYRVGSSCMQGWRVTMEDCHVHILSLPDDPGTAFFAVYDGHGGETMAHHAGKHLHEYIVRQNDYKNGNIVRAIQQGFLELDKDMQADEALKNSQAGTTVIAILIKDNVLYSANAGDSRAVASVNGTAVALSEDHKPVLKEEQDRIEAAGGWVEFNRVNGHLALSRALGDFMFKQNENKKPEEQIVTAFPDVQIHEITEEWEFTVLACDGIWDVMTCEEVVQFVRERLVQSADQNPDEEKDGESEKNQNLMDPEDVCEELLSHCVAPDTTMGTGCDNMTVIIVCFLHGKPYASYIARLKEAIERESN